MGDYDPIVQTEGTETPDALFAGDFPRVTEEVTVISGQTVARGDVLGKITASGKWILSASAAGDGSEVPRAVAAEAIDASAADAVGVVYRTGEFADDEVTLGTGHTIASIRDAAADKGIFFKAVTA